MFYETHVESVNFSSESGFLLLRRYRLISLWAKESIFPLDEVVRVHAAKRGMKNTDID